MMENKTTELLTTQNLSVGYPANKIENVLFEQLNLSLSEGQLVCFMGSNGIGKSTLIRTLAGLQKPLSGKVLYKNNPSFDTSQKISVVLTDRISANLTVLELITYGRYPYLDWTISVQEKDRSIIDDAVQSVRIERLLKKRLFELSDGQMQMVMIARALAQDGEILLLDEPTAHLDLNNRVEIMNLLRNLSRSTKKAILIATHELDLALQTADRIWLADRKKNIQTGIPEDLVLDGSFDEIFQLKGFDLKTGRMHHTPYRNTMIQLVGSGYEFLWTKNALERCGFQVTESITPMRIILQKLGSKFQWIVQQNESTVQFNTLDQVINSLNQSIAKESY
ncbi:MAG: ABC transporter ATP-binding protein [Cyclobacteriaceae bacterium]|nr:ABC transporter ATP-binding protein [Cyclobacteriaceae bacterium]